MNMNILTDNDISGMYIALVLIWYFFYKCKNWKPYQDKDKGEQQ